MLCGGCNLPIPDHDQDRHLVGECSERSSYFLSDPAGLGRCGIYSIDGIPCEEPRTVGNERRRTGGELAVFFYSCEKHAACKPVAR